MKTILSLKAPSKMHPKRHLLKSSEAHICLRLLTINVNVEANSVEPDQTALTGAV